jgi:hypothetical protein
LRSVPREIVQDGLVRFDELVVQDKFRVVVNQADSREFIAVLCQALDWHVCARELPVKTTQTKGNDWLPRRANASLDALGW